MAAACVVAGHDVRVLDHTQQRCATCCRTYLVDSTRGVVQTEVDRQQLVDRPAGPGVCPSHPGELARCCRACRADRLAADPELRPVGVQLDVELVERNRRGMAAVRAAMTARQSRDVTT